MVSLAFLAWALASVPYKAGAADAVVDVVYPGDGHVTKASRIFVFGSAMPGAHIVVNGLRATTYENGAFLAVISLQPGPNQVVTVAKSPRGTAVDRRKVEFLGRGRRLLKCGDFALDPVNHPLMEGGREPKMEIPARVTDGIRGIGE